MARRLSLLLAAAAVLPFAAPAVSSAATGLTEGGVLIAAGKKLDYTNVGNVTITSAKTGNIVCATATLTGEVTVNNAALVRVAGVPGTSFLANCAVGGAAVIPTNFVFTSEETAGGG